MVTSRPDGDEVGGGEHGVGGSLARDEPAHDGPRDRGGGHDVAGLLAAGQAQQHAAEHGGLLGSRGRATAGGEVAAPEPSIPHQARLCPAFPAVPAPARPHSAGQAPVRADRAVPAEPVEPVEPALSRFAQCRTDPAAEPGRPGPGVVPAPPDHPQTEGADPVLAALLGHSASGASYSAPAVALADHPWPGEVREADQPV